jgi:dihydroorotate dehydrogenase
VLYRFARPLLFALDAEAAHDLTFKGLQHAERCGLTRLLGPHVGDDSVEVMGLRFRNPVGLAAGLDKNAAHIDALGDLGFGFIEVGTVTPRPQAGNPKPRMFRIPEAGALINRLGFNNAGLESFKANVTRSRRFRAAGGIVGLNLGKNADTPIERALDDYAAGLRAVFPLLAQKAGYVTVNISSPNTKNLRALQNRAELQELLAGLRDERARLADRHGHMVPIALKISPDLEDDDLPRIADALVEHGFDAVIATNATLSRDVVRGFKVAEETGGLSGAPLRARANEVVRRLSRHLRGALPIIGVGGIDSAAAARERLESGASLIQIYTGLIYRGPTLVGELRRAALGRPRRSG